jgi:hypothetical protein
LELFKGAYEFKYILNSIKAKCKVQLIATGFKSEILKAGTNEVMEMNLSQSGRTQDVRTRLAHDLLTEEANLCPNVSNVNML